MFIVVSVPMTLLAQKEPNLFADKFPFAKLVEKPLFEFDVARPIKHFDALPDGSNWFAVDEFGLLQTIIINGVQYEKRFNEIPPPTAKFSPNGKYMIWMGLERSYDEKGFNTTQTTTYRVASGTTKPDSVAKFQSDNNMLTYSASGNHWAGLYPASKSDQLGLRDVVLVDGLIVAKDNPRPWAFAFDRDEKNWAYRSTDGPDENLVTTFSTQRMYRRKVTNPMLPSPDPIVYHFTPTIRVHPFMLDSRDYDFDFPHQAIMFKTSYLLEKQDTSHVYVIFNSKRQQNFRWINSIQIDTTGEHIYYFACDTLGQGNRAVQNERHGVLVKDGEIIGGPFYETGRVYLSPSGKNLAWTASEKGIVSLYLNGKVIGKVGQYTDVSWSPDETHFAYVSSDETNKLFIVSGQKRSPSYDRIGQIGWSSDHKSVEFCAIKYNKLLHLKQAF